MEEIHVYNTCSRFQIIIHENDLKGTLCHFYSYLVVKCYIAFKDCSLAPHVVKCALQPVETTAGGKCQDSRSYDMSRIPRGAFCPSGQSID